MNSIEDTISEGDTYPLTADFADTNWISGAPTSVSYRVDCETNQRPIADWTAVTPASSVSITITSTQNAIIDDSNTRERKVVLVKAIDSDGAQRSVKFRYWVNNDQGVP